MNARTAFIEGNLTLEEFERAEEHRLLSEAGRDQPVPAGWKPLPPCEHRWIEVARVGHYALEGVCGDCGATTWQSREAWQSREDGRE